MRPIYAVFVLSMRANDILQKGDLYHELAHVWDRTLDESHLGPSLEIAMGVQRAGGAVVQDVYQKSKPDHGDFPTAYSLTNLSEHLADSVEGYFLTDEYAAYRPPDVTPTRVVNVHRRAVASSVYRFPRGPGTPRCPKATPLGRKAFTGLKRCEMV